MPKTEDVTVKKGAYGKAIEFTCYQADGSTAYDFTDLTATLKIWKENVPGTLVLEEECTVSDASGGVCSYTPSEGDFDTVGVYLYEIEATNAGGTLKDPLKSGHWIVEESA